MILNRQNGVRVSIQDLEKFLARARRALGIPAGALTVCLVNNAEIARWNFAYRGKKKPTDVLSFPANGARGKQKMQNARGQASPRRGLRSVRSRTSAASSARYLGDIAIAPVVARRNARRFGRAFSDEMRILILHGILHLMGYDHETDNGRMDRREQRLRRQLGLA
ncbi:MAG: rRNA maturation RNase YbeY [Candidatus Acidiferrales bacterium]